MLSAETLQGLVEGDQVETPGLLQGVCPEQMVMLVTARDSTTWDFMVSYMDVTVLVLRAVLDGDKVKWEVVNAQ